MELNLYELTTVQQLEALKAGRIDIGFGRLHFPEDDDVIGETVREEPVLVALPADHRSYADQVLEMFQSRNLKPVVALEANEMQTAIGLVVAGLGYALVPQSVQALHREGVLYLPLSDEGVTTPVVMNRRRNDESELTTYLCEMVWALPTSTRAKTAAAKSASPSGR